VTDCQFNLLQLEARPNWYDHLEAAENAMRQEQAAWNIRQEYGWDGDEGGEWGPNPLDPDQTIMASDWGDELALPMPEDFDEADSYVFEIMLVIGKHKDDPAMMAHAVALRAAEYLSAWGQPTIGKIKGQLDRRMK
jgi:hypothetical protein